MLDLKGKLGHMLDSMCENFSTKAFWKCLCYYIQEGKRNRVGEKGKRR